MRAIGLLVVLLVSFSANAQKQETDRPAPIEPAQGANEARKLIAEILQQRPGELPANATLKIRDPEGNERSLPVQMDLTETSTNWTQVYQTTPHESQSGDRLTIIHAFGKPSRYLFSRSGQTNDIELTGNQTMVPFAGSDFWIADFGLDFLYWPKQRLVKKEMRSHKACVMLESINPSAAKDGYARVESWMTLEKPHSPVVAQAYDSSGKQIKVFTLEGVEKVDGKYQLRAIEMRNLKSKTRSLLEFNW